MTKRFLEGVGIELPEAVPTACCGRVIATAALEVVAICPVAVELKCVVSSSHQESLSD